MECPWEFYKSLKIRSLYKNKWLQGRGLTASQISEIMRKFKVYVDRIDQSPIGVRVRSVVSIDEMVHILDNVFENEWKNHIKDSYKDMPYYFRDYAKFLGVIRKYVKGYIDNDISDGSVWPNGSSIEFDDIVSFMKTKHNHIRITIDGNTNIYSGSNALIKVCQNIGFEDASKINLTTNGLKLLVKHVPLGKETKYMEAGEGWYLCTSCDTKVKLRLIKITVAHFQKDIKAELV